MDPYGSFRLTNMTGDIGLTARSSNREREEARIVVSNFLIGLQENVTAAPATRPARFLHAGYEQKDCFPGNSEVVARFWTI